LRCNYFSAFSCVSVTSSITLDCRYTSWTTQTPWQYIYYACEAQVRGNGFVVTGVSQNHLQGKSDSDVETVLIENHFIGQFPKNIEEFYPNIKALSFIKCGIKTVSSADLRPFPMLDYIDLSESSIEALGSDLFVHNPGLKLMYFHYNKIRHVGHNLFTPISELPIMQTFFNGNLCIDESTPVSMGRGIPLDELIWKIFMQCPMPIEMIENEIIIGTKFTKKFEGIDERTEKLEKQNDGLKDLIDERTEELETQIKKLKDLVDKIMIDQS
jgi:hypothetical protein